MSKSNSTLTAARLRELLLYHPETGDFTWRAQRKKMPAGSAAGCDKGDGYLVISIDGRKHRAHRLAWLYMTGEWPPEEIDHRDRNRRNNRWSNLRAVSPATNKENQTRSSAAGFPGVRVRKSGRFEAQIQAKKIHLSLGTYDTAEEAHNVYLLHKRELHVGSTM